MAPTSVKQLQKQARTALSEKDHDGVMSICRDILKQDKSNYHAYVFIGVAASATGNSERAIQSYQRAIELRPNVPLAYKGLTETLRNPQDAHQRLILARAHVGLGSNSEQHATESLQLGAKLLYFLALEDSGLVSEAVSALRVCQSGSICNLIERPDGVYKIAHLLAIKAGGTEARASDGTTHAWDEQAISDALDEVVSIILAGSMRPSYAMVNNRVAERAVSMCLQGLRFDECIAVLRFLCAYDDILQISETDFGANSLAGEKALIAMKSIHLYPYQPKTTRSRHILAAEVYVRTRQVEFASRIAELGTLRLRNIESGDSASMPSLTEIFVTALLRYVREEYKLSLQISRIGQSICAKRNDCDGSGAMLGLLAAASLKGDRKFKESIKEFERVRAYAQDHGDTWMELSANRGIVETAVLGHGRRSRQTSTAIEEAASSSQNVFGLLESVWTDALTGEIDLIRMKELTAVAVENAHNEQENIPYKLWEHRALNPTFSTSSSKLAAVALTRLGQMITKEEGTTEDALSQAQGHYMEAARYAANYSDPFAHLGFVFEKRFAQTKNEKMRTRAIRCYEKAVTLDSAHPLASRRLVQMLADQALLDVATDVARAASDRNPRARWAHNFVGWSRILHGRFKEAAASFRNSLRGKLPYSWKTEEVLFGTDLSAANEDNDLVVGIDSWRGMCAAYIGEGKIGPALACIEDALSLVRNPPKAFVATFEGDLSAVQRSTEVLLEVEKAMLELFSRRILDALDLMRSLIGRSAGVMTIRYYISEVYIHMAAEEWLRGNYTRASSLRNTAGSALEAFLMEEMYRQPQLNYACMLKSVGDIWMETGTDRPAELAQLISPRVVEQALHNSTISYSKSAHLAPWNFKEGHGVDLGGAWFRISLLRKNISSARKAVQLIIASNSDAALQAISILQLSMLSPDKSLKTRAKSISQQVVRSPWPKRNYLPLHSTIAIFAARDDLKFAAECAVASLRHDPTDWKAWYAVATVREADAEHNEWPHEMIRSCQEAYSEADRLGCGPAALQGIIRCVSPLLHSLSSKQEITEESYTQACYSLSVSSRAGVEAPSVSRQIIARYRSTVETNARAILKNNTGGGVEFCRTVHMFPFLAEAKAARLSVT